MKNEALADFTADRRMLPLSALAVAIGVIGAAAAVALLRLIGLFTNLFFYHRLATTLVAPAGSPLGPAIVAVPVIGSLVIGLMARYGSEKIRGHGIPEALEAILLRGSRIPPKLALLKPLSAAISIGSGVAGAAAGMSATFATPIAATLLAIELLLFEWKPRSFVPVALASTTAVVARRFVLGAGPLFPSPAPPSFIGVHALLACVLVGVAAGALSSPMTQDRRLGAGAKSCGAISTR